MMHLIATYFFVCI